MLRNVPPPPRHQLLFKAKCEECSTISNMNKLEKKNSSTVYTVYKFWKIQFPPTKRNLKTEIEYKCKSNVQYSIFCVQLYSTMYNVYSSRRADF